MPAMTAFARDLFTAQSVGQMLGKIGLFPFGNIFFVDSGHASARDVGGNAGDSPQSPFATIDYAIGRCTASNGDIILVAPGHVETVSGAAGINMDVAGVTVYCVGWQGTRPTITLSAVASTIAFGAANCCWYGGLITVSDDATIAFDLNIAGTLLDGIEMKNAAAKEAVTWIDVGTGSAANTCDRTTIRNCVIKCPNIGTTGAIELGAVADNVVIEGCDIDGDFGDACIHNPTGFILTKLMIRKSSLRNTQTGDHAIELVSACTGRLEDNRYYTDMTQQTGVDPGSCFSCECYQDDVIDASGILTPIIT